MERRTRVRFAPSPTGPLHMGGVRTALYNYLYAKAHGGDFVLRIEDTDSSRLVPGAEEYIIEALRWCGILPEEGVDENGKVVSEKSARHPHAPYRQSERREIYFDYAKRLVEAGHAYYAFDTPEELSDMRARAEAAGETFVYNQKTRLTLRNSLTLGAQETARLLEEDTHWTIRFKMPENVVVAMDDLIRGHIEVNTDTLDDKVLWKRADKLPTYHLANIVDDHLMEITEVIRGEEWLPSLPLHYLLYRAFGWEDTMPRFAHLSLLLKPDGKGKLSKRDGDKMGFPVFPLRWVNSQGEVYKGYREDGYFPEAFVNLLAFLGWNPGDEREIFSLDELVEAFSLERIVRAGARFNAEKARWYNREYLRMKSPDALTDLFIPVLQEKGITVMPDGPVDFEGSSFPREYVRRVVELVSERAFFVRDMWTVASYLFISPARFEVFGVKAGATVEVKPADPRKADPRAKVYDESLSAPFAAKDVDKFWKKENYDLAEDAARFLIEGDFEWTAQNIGTRLEGYIKDNGWPMGKVMNCLRLALSGSSSGLGIADILSFIGKEEFGKRMQYIISRDPKA